MWNIKNDINKLIYNKKHTYRHKNKLMMTKGDREVLGARVSRGEIN